MFLRMSATDLSLRVVCMLYFICRYINKLVTTQSDVEAEEAFIKETITRGYQEAKEGRLAGQNLNSLDALIDELRAEA